MANPQVHGWHRILKKLSARLSCQMVDVVPNMVHGFERTITHSCS